MQVDLGRLRELMHLYEEEFDEKLTEEEAQAMATRLLALYEKLSAPTPPEQTDKEQAGERSDDLQSP